MSNPQDLRGYQFPSPLHTQQALQPQQQQQPKPTPTYLWVPLLPSDASPPRGNISCEITQRYQQGTPEWRERKSTHHRERFDSLSRNRYLSVQFFLNEQQQPDSFSSKTYPTEQEAVGDDVSSQIPEGGVVNVLQKVYRIDLSAEGMPPGPATDAVLGAVAGALQAPPSGTTATAVLISSLLRPMTSKGASTSPLRGME